MKSNPAPDDKANRLRIYKSFEEAAEEEAYAAAQQTPVERLRQTFEPILRVYGVTREELNERRGKPRLHITRRK
jgi:ParB-like chromosome segregation protein Spo0J